MSIESVMASNHLMVCCPLLLLPSIFPNIRVFSNESVLHIRWPVYGFNDETDFHWKIGVPWVQPLPPLPRSTPLKNYLLPFTSVLKNRLWASSPDFLHWARRGLLSSPPPIPAHPAGLCERLATRILGKHSAQALGDAQWKKCLIILQMLMKKADSRPSFTKCHTCFSCPRRSWKSFHCWLRKRSDFSSCRVEFSWASCLRYSHSAWERSVTRGSVCRNRMSANFRNVSMVLR